MRSVAGRDLHDAAAVQACDGRGHELVLLVAVAQLPLVATAERVGGTVIGGQQSVRAAHRDAGDALQWHWPGYRQPRDVHAMAMQAVAMRQGKLAGGRRARLLVACHLFPHSMHWTA